MSIKLPMATILISGGTGLIGTALIEKLVNRNYRVHNLTRNPAPSGKTKDHQFFWDPAKKEIDETALKGVKGVIHLAGAGIADKRWTERRKREIISSRTQGAQLLKTAMAESGSTYAFFISASGANYYGTFTSDTIFTEDDAAGDDFLAEVCVLWEKQAFDHNPAERVAVVRTAMVLSNRGGALPKLAATVKHGFGAVLGSGKQFNPWIHIDDLCEIYLKIASDESMRGAYNAVADEHVTHATLMHQIASAYDTKIRLPNIPGWLLKTGLGEMSGMLLKGSRLSNDKLHEAGFRFRHPMLKDALDDLIRTL